MSEPRPILDDPFDGLVTKETSLRIKSPPQLPHLEQYNKPNKGRHYKLLTGEMVPSVTNVLGILDKPALSWWGASVERDMVVEHAIRAFRTNPTSYDAFEKILVGMLPRQQARFRKAKVQADIGVETHGLIQWRCKEMICLNDPEGSYKWNLARPKASQDAELAFLAWEEWADKINLKPKLVEQTVFSHRLKAAGTVDLYGEQDWPEPGVRRDMAYDWKSSKVSKTRPNGIYDESLIQVATYADMLVELGVAPDNCMACIVRLPKTLEDPFFDTGELDTVELMPDTRRSYADGFLNIRKTFTFMKEEI